MRRLFAITALLFLAACSSSSTPQPATLAHERSPRPINFVILLADDLGYGDLGCNGSPIIKSPNIDQLAAEGMRFTSYYAAHPNCSPSRAGLLTGRNPNRMGIYNWIAEGSPMYLRPGEITIAKTLQAAGYATAQVGKWHLNGGMDMPQPQPVDHGFDFYFAAQNNAQPSHKNPTNFYRNGTPLGEMQGYSSEIVADQATQWLRNRPKNKPFFLYVAFHEPHEPIATAERHLDQYNPREDLKRAEYYGNVTQMDAAVGRIVGAIDELGLKGSTFVMFASDNGPARDPGVNHPFGSAGPLRDSKGGLYDGGIRVPGIIRFPGRIKPHSVSDTPICGVDLYPTIAKIAGVPIPLQKQLDGVNIEPLFRDQQIVRSTPLYWHFVYAHTKPKVAIRIGDWKLLATLTPDPFNARNGGAIGAGDIQALKTAALGEFELYNLREDIGESRDQAAAQPQRLAAMTAELRKVYSQVQQQAPMWPEWKPTPKRSPKFEVRNPKSE